MDRRRRRPRLRTLLVGWIPLLLAFAVVQAVTASNHVEPSRAGHARLAADPRSLAPIECARLNLRNVLVVTAGRLRGTEGNDLMLGTPGNDRLDGEGGDDCLVAGGGRNDRLYGGPGFDVCIGNATTQFHDCEVEIRR